MPAGAGGGVSGTVEVVEYTDPFWAWAWSTEPKVRLLRAALGPAVRWRQVLGVLLDGEPEHRDLAARVADQLERSDAVVAHTRARRCRRGSSVPPQRAVWPRSRSRRPTAGT